MYSLIKLKSPLIIYIKLKLTDKNTYIAGHTGTPNQDRPNQPPNPLIMRPFKQQAPLLKQKSKNRI